MGEGKIDHAIRVGHLRCSFHGAYGLGHAGVGWRGEMFAAVLASGAGSVVSHGSSAFLLGLWERRPESIDVIAPVEAARKIPGIRRRFVPMPRPNDRWSHDGIPCTSPSRTIVDIAGIVGERALRRTIEQAAVRRMLDLPMIDEILEGPRRRGSPRLRAVLDDWRSYERGTKLRSVMEAKLLSLVAQRGLPAPECNVPLKLAGASFEVDFLWRRQRFVVETDGERYHGNPEAEKRDRDRDARLTAAGYRVLRISWYDLEQGSAPTIAKLRNHLHP